MTELDKEWYQFLAAETGTDFMSKFASNNTSFQTKVQTNIHDSTTFEHDSTTFEACGLPDYELVISTKTKVLFLNSPIDIQTVFWKIPIIEYWQPINGVIKKQMKVVSNSPEEYNEYVKKLETIPYYNEYIIKQIQCTNTRGSKFKDERKITIGMTKKDISSHRSKMKNAFYNCFAMILRFEYLGSFKEIHVKVFNTGKMEIPGVVNYHILNVAKDIVLGILKPIVSNSKELQYIENSQEDHVLINSNFNCGFNINRERLHSTLCSSKYGIESAYDPCSYPGVKCKFYFKNEYGLDTELQTGRLSIEDRALKLSELMESKKYTEVSFMIFRTGSGLIVGNCSEKVLRFIFAFIKKTLNNEYDNIRVTDEIASRSQLMKPKKPKMKKRSIQIRNQSHV
jgi:hypothetical protein